MPYIPSPPAHARRLRCDDIDELRVLLRPEVGDHSRVLHGAGPLRFEQLTTGSSRVTVGWVSVGAEQTVRGQLRAPCLHLLLAGGATYRVGSRRIVAAPGTLTLVGAGQEYTRHSAPGVVLAVQCDPAAIADELSHRYPEAQRSWSIRTCALRNGHRTWEPLARALDELVMATAPRTAAKVMEHSEARLMEVLVGMLPDEAAFAPVPRLAASRLAALEEWMEANLSEPITLGRLCREAGVGERTLQQTYQARRGMSPMRHLTERRLAAARRRLQCAQAGDSVTHIALAVGFGHLGRFAVMYRELYGDCPSQTLRDALARRMPRAVADRR